MKSNTKKIKKERIEYPVIFDHIKTIPYQLEKDENVLSFQGLTKIDSETFYKPIIKT